MGISEQQLRRLLRTTTLDNIAHALQEAYEEGYNEGFDSGEISGREDGYAEGVEETEEEFTTYINEWQNVAALFGCYSPEDLKDWHSNMLANIAQAVNDEAPST